MKEFPDSATGVADLPDKGKHHDRFAMRPDTPPDRVRGELRQLLSSRTFQGAEAHKRFLQFAVEQTLAGSSREVKEFTIGIHVFKRGSRFDPRLDPIVRVEARKLRSRLTKYYETEGEHDSIRIELPSRGYVPVFRESDAPVSVLDAPAMEANQVPAESGGAKAVTGVAAFANRWRWAGLLGMILVAAGLAISAGRFILRDRGPENLSPSIAVLPFQNLGDVKDESFSDGLTDELINSLGRVQGLQVVGRTSAFQFRAKTLDIREIGRKLNVRTVLEGGVRIYGDRLRITAELVDTTNGYSVWSSSYDRDFKDALFVQREISQAIVATLEEKLAQVGDSKGLKFSPAKAGPVNVEAYREYLRGLYFWNKQTGEDIQTARGHFEHSIALDPGYAPAYTGLARCYVNLPSFSAKRARDIVPKIKELALKALELDSDSPEAHVDLAYVSFLEYDWAGADVEFKKGLELGPGDPVAHDWYSTYLVNVGRLEEGLAESKIAQQLDPVSPSMPVRTARSFYLMRRYAEAIEQYKKALELDPQFLYAHLGLGTVYIQEGKYKEAVAEILPAQPRLGSNPSAPSELARAYPPIGKAPEARKILREFLRLASEDSFPAKPIAKVYLALGERDQAFEWLEKAVMARDTYLYLKADPIWDPIRTDPRFAHLLQAARLTATP